MTKRYTISSASGHERIILICLLIAGGLCEALLISHQLLAPAGIEIVANVSPGHGSMSFQYGPLGRVFILYYCTGIGIVLFSLYNRTMNLRKHVRTFSNRVRNWEALQKSGDYKFSIDNLPVLMATSTESRHLLLFSGIMFVGYAFNALYNFMFHLLFPVTGVNISPPVGLTIPTGLLAILAMIVMFFALISGGLMGISKNRLRAESKDADDIELVVAFVDLRGSSMLMKERNLFKYEEFWREYFSIAHDIVERYRGRIKEMKGDGLIAYWGEPKLLENNTNFNVFASAISAILSMSWLTREVAHLAEKYRIQEIASKLSSDPAVSRSTGHAGAGIEITGPLNPMRLKIETFAKSDIQFADLAIFDPAMNRIAELASLAGQEEIIIGPAFLNHPFLRGRFPIEDIPQELLVKQKWLRYENEPFMQRAARFLG